MSNLSKKKEIISVGYFLGLIESDGTFLLNFKKGNPKNRLSAEMRFSQSSNPNLKEFVKDFFDYHGIPFTIEENTVAKEGKKGRAGSVCVEGNDNIRKLFKIIEDAHLPFVFAGVKQRAFLILKEVLFNPNLTNADRVGLKLSLHKEHRSEDDIITPQGLTREQMEERSFLEPGASHPGSENVLRRIDEMYKEHRLSLHNAMENNTLVVDPGWISGVFDGDGHFGVYIRDRESYVDWSSDCSIVTEHRSLMTLAVIRYIACSKKPFNQGFSRVTGELSSVSIGFESESDIQNILNFIQPCDIQGNVRCQQRDLVVKLYELRKTRALRNQEIRENFIREIYAVVDLSNKGRPRKYNADEWIEISNEIYNKSVLF